LAKQSSFYPRQKNNLKGQPTFNGTLVSAAGELTGVRFAAGVCAHVTLQVRARAERRLTVLTLERPVI